MCIEDDRRGNKKFSLGSLSSILDKNRYMEYTLAICDLSFGGLVKKYQA